METLIFGLLCLGSAASAIWTKEWTSARTDAPPPALADVRYLSIRVSAERAERDALAERLAQELDEAGEVETLTPTPAPTPTSTSAPVTPPASKPSTPTPTTVSAAPGRAMTATERALLDPRTRFFNGRPIRPARTMTMIVTAYSPDERSCGDSADGITATLHHVETNAFRLVAADTRLLPFGSMISVPGYDAGRVVPVLDRGGAIKGHRLDVLFPTHEQARAWGVRKLRVTVWEYADGKPMDDPRRLR
ncbi:MAG: 3D domain-containing protein [Planctomycetota bacterium]|nr:3D domain-containing protein [Planctomycetota bacterium]